MKCFTIDNFEAMDGIRVARAMRPHLLIAKNDQILLGPELVTRMRECLLDPEQWTGEDLRFDKVFSDVLVHRASLVIDDDFGTFVVSETDDESRQRALVLLQADLQHTGIELSGRSVEFGTHPSIEITEKVTRTLISERQSKTSGDSFDEGFRCRTTLVVMKAGDYLETSVSWFKVNGRRMWVPAERAPRLISRVSFDGSTLTLEELSILGCREKPIFERW